MLTFFKQGLWAAQQNHGFIGPQGHLRLRLGVWVVGQQDPVSLQVHRALPGTGLSVEVADAQQPRPLPAAPVGQHRGAPLVQGGEVPLGDHVVLSAQLDQGLVVGEDGVRVVHLGGGVDFLTVGVDADPRVPAGGAAVF